MTVITRWRRSRRVRLGLAVLAVLLVAPAAWVIHRGHPAAGTDRVRSWLETDPGFGAALRLAPAAVAQQILARTPRVDQDEAALLAPARAGVPG